MKKINSGFTSIEFLVLLLIAVMLSLYIGFVISIEHRAATRAMESAHYSNVQFLDHTWLFVGLRGHCEAFDTAQFTVRATNPAGKQTEVIVCTSFGRGEIVAQ